MPNKTSFIAMLLVENAVAFNLLKCTEEVLKDAEKWAEHMRFLHRLQSQIDQEFLDLWPQITHREMTRILRTNEMVGLKYPTHKSMERTEDD